MFFKTSVAVATTAIGLTALAYPAQAAQFFFTYTHGGPTTPIVVTGTLTGDLGPGGIITINGFSDITYNGVDLDTTIWQSGTSVSDYEDFFMNMGTIPGQASFDGSVMNFVLVTNGLNDFIGFGTGLFEEDGNPAFLSSLLETTLELGNPITNDLGGVEEPFNQAGWSIQLIPEPSAVVALLGLGLGALASRVRKQG